MFAETPTNLALGLIAGMTIFLGLPVARLKGASESLRGMLALASAGVLMFLIIEVGYHAIDTVEGSAKSGDLSLTLLQAVIFIGGLLLGLVGLAFIEEQRHQIKGEGATPLEIANMIAIGIGLHNFAEGLAIGQSYSSGNTTFGLILVLGFALHNATEGFGIAAPLTGINVSWSKLITLGLIAGAPTALGSALGGSFVNTNLELFILSLAVGSLIYVTRELLRLRFNSLTTSKAMLALSLGLIIGIGTEIYIEAAMVNSGQKISNKSIDTAIDKKVYFEEHEIEPNQLTISRGENILLINKTDKPLEIEAKGLLNKEAFIAQGGQLAVQITGVPGNYIINPEKSSLIAHITVVPGKTNMAQADAEQIVTALTILEGHVHAAFDLHEDAAIAHNPNKEVDLARAKKHAYHPVHELFEDKSPHALLVQSELEKIGALNKLKESLEEFSQLAGDSRTPSIKFAKSYADLLALVEKTRRTVGGKEYDEPEFKGKCILAVLAQAEDEYKEAVETGKIVVIKAAQPGKDGYLEYQDVRGFLKAAGDLLNLCSEPKYINIKMTIDTLIGDKLESVNPIDPAHPTPFKEMEKRFEKIERLIE